MRDDSLVRTPPIEAIQKIFAWLMCSFSRPSARQNQQSSSGRGLHSLSVGRRFRFIFAHHTHPVLRFCIPAVRNRVIKTAGGDVISVRGIGKVNPTFHSEGNVALMTLGDVLVVPGRRFDFFSLKLWHRSGKRFTGGMR